ncbi:MAG: hypothetical protein WCV86_01610 [Patescibacteria group bacterium]|jgi:hypothetical protein
MDFLLLSVIFFASGVLALAYYHFVPSADALRRRLPNKVSPAALLLTAVLAGALWYLFSNYAGFSRYYILFALLFALLIFETVFLLLIRWVRSDTLLVTVSLVSAGGIFAVEIAAPSFVLLNSIVIIATFGAATLLVRLNMLRTWMFHALAILWTFYDIWLVREVLPRVFKPSEPTAEPRYFFFPVITAGRLSLGSGDVMFLVLMALVLFREYGKTAAFTLVVAETAGLLATGLFLPEDGFQIPFLVVMTPIFFLVYGVAWWQRRRITSRSSPRL